LEAARVIITWDPKKAESNRRKHGVDFREAATVLEDTLSTTFPDPDHSVDEERFVTIGQSRAGRILVVAHADRAEDEVRIISAAGHPARVEVL
jgi:uncharacterized DUF497 family protein